MRRSLNPLSTVQPLPGLFVSSELLTGVLVQSSATPTSTAQQLVLKQKKIEGPVGHIIKVLFMSFFACIRIRCFVVKFETLTGACYELTNTPAGDCTVIRLPIQ
jgi:hypothetical protein